MDFSAEDLAMDGHFLHLEGESSLVRDPHLVTISMFPDDVLLDIFDFHVYIDDSIWVPRRNMWHALVHVCRRWRYLVFASPRRLNLRIAYYGRRPMSVALEAWPILPITLASMESQSDRQLDNTVAALESEHYNRICEIYTKMTNSHWERFVAAMQKPFPELTDLKVWTTDLVPVLPDSFLGRSAPRLRTLWLLRIPLLSLPKLLLSAPSLVFLTLISIDIPDSGFISPNAMATALTVMTRLESLDLGFRYPRSRPDPAGRPLPPPIHFVLPALTQFEFKGNYEYLEDLLALIDVPLLYFLHIEFFMDLAFNVPQLHRFIGHAEEFKTFDHIYVWIDDLYIQLLLYPNTAEVDDGRGFRLEISCRELDYQLSSLAQVCSSSFSFVSTLEELQIKETYGFSSSHWKDDMENAQWLELLDPFTALKNLYLADGIAQRFCGAFQELSEARSIEVLPTLRNLFVPVSSLQPVKEAMMSFIATRQLSDHPVVVDHWEG